MLTVFVGNGILLGMQKHAMPRFSRCVLWTLLTTVLMGTGPVGADEYADSEYWRPYLDQPHTLLWRLGGGYALPAPPSRAGWDDVGVIEVEGRASLWYYENTRGTDFELNLLWDNFILQGMDGLDSAYPLTMARLRFQVSQRMQNGWGLRADVSPGYYATLEDPGSEDFYYPFGLTGFWALNSHVAAHAGLSVYPEFDHTLDPRVGLRFVNDSVVQVDIAYPESRIRLSPYEGMAVYAYARFLKWPEFQMDHSDRRKKLRYDETRYGLGLEFGSDTFRRWFIEVGQVSDRKIEFERHEGSVELEDSIYLRGGLLRLL